MGLKLNRGPDPRLFCCPAVSLVRFLIYVVVSRSFHPGLAAMAATGRTLYGLEM